MPSRTRALSPRARARRGRSARSPNYTPCPIIQQNFTEADVADTKDKLEALIMFARLFLKLYILGSFLSCLVHAKPRAVPLSLIRC